MKQAISFSFVIATLAMVGCGPSPEGVCDHTLALAKAELGDEAAEAALGSREDCVKSEERRKEMQGMIKYKDKNKCLMAAKTWEEASKCS